jgi:hypothetical protein
VFCCVNCFCDQGLKKRIESLSSKIGDCNFCESKQAVVVSCAELSSEFEQLFEMYTPHSNAKKSLGQDHPFQVHEHLIEYWPRLFDMDRLTSNVVLQLVNQIGRGWDNYSDEFFEIPVELGTLMVSAAGPVEDLELKWDMFSEEIKTLNRFFIGEKIETERLESVFERLIVNYPSGLSFYRARISDTHLPANELGKPPKNLTAPGRANPVGIPYLYISDSKETTLYETRVALHEGITVGTFVTTETMNVVSLKNIAHHAPFEILDRGFALDEFILVRPYLIRLEHELSRPVRKMDIHLDYLPTQYLCEFIKSLGFDGVEYKSAMNTKGYNLAVFKDGKLKCEDSTFHHVTNLTYAWDPK